MKTPGYQRFFAELKRRKVFKVAAVYGAVAFGLIQVADPLSEAMQLPETFLPLVVATLLLGFPVALVLAWAFEVTPDGMQRTEEAAPGEIERIVAQPASKRWPAGLLALAGIAALIAGAWYAGRQSGSDSVQARTEVMEASIAVLPFVNMSSDEEQDYFSDGISEELLNLLAKIPELRVAARTSSFSFKGQNLEIPVIAERLNVAHVLEGSVRKADDQVRVTAQLIRAEDGFHLWSDTWDRTLDDIFAIQDEIAADVVDQLRVTLLDEAPTVEETDPEAYALVLQARHLSEQRTPESVTRAEELYREALAIDPEYAPGWSGLALNYRRQGNIGSIAYQDGTALAREAAEKALAVDPSHALAHTILGLIAENEGDLAGAARHHERALALDPGDARGVGAAALALETFGRLEEAIQLLEYQVARDPIGLAGHVNLGLAYIGTRRWDSAVESLRTAMELNPAAGGVRSFLGYAMLYTGEPEAGLSLIQDEPLEVFRLISTSMAYHVLGRTAESDATLAELIEKYERDAAYNIAYVVAYRGEIDRAFDWLDKSAIYEDPGLGEIFVQPEFEALHDDPRWPVFLERIGRSPEDLAAIEFEVRLPE
jgi:TolB-like protein/Tfp pilus assembly protein PilF